MPMITGAPRPMPKSYRDAYRADRALFARVGREEYDRIQQERIDYYRDLIRKAKSIKSA